VAYRVPAGADQWFVVYRLLAGATLGVFALACGATTASDCYEKVVAVRWVEHTWGTVPINAVWVGVADGSLLVRSAREDGSTAGLDQPGRFGVVPVTSDHLVGIAGVPATDELTVITREATTFVSTLGGGLWDEGPRIPTSFALRALTASESGDRWAVGAGGYIARLIGAEWTGEQYTADDLEGVWASDDSVWTVGGASVLRRSGDASFEDAGLVAAGLHGVFGLPTGEVFVVGDGGGWFRWDGAEWSQIVTPTESALRCVWADPELGAWAGGDDGALLHLAPGATEASAEKPPSSEFNLAITAIYGSRTTGVGYAPTELALWVGTAEGSALSKEAVVSTICE